MPQNLLVNNFKWVEDISEFDVIMKNEESYNEESDK